MNPNLPPPATGQPLTTPPPETAPFETSGRPPEIAAAEPVRRLPPAAAGTLPAGEIPPLRMVRRRPRAEPVAPPAAAPAPESATRDRHSQRPGKLSIALTASLAWAAASTWLAMPWMSGLAGFAGWPLSILAVTGVALFPGLVSVWLATRPLLRRRSVFRPLGH